VTGVQTCALPIFTLYCRDASIRLKAEQVPVLKQHLDDSRSWAEAQKDDFALLGVKPGPK
jgi:hypothetical protein